MIPPLTPRVYLGLFADGTCIYATNRKEAYVLRKLQRGLNSLESRCERWNIKINEDKTQAICFCHRRRPAEAHLTLNGRNIPFVNQVKYLGVIVDKRITWRFHIEMIEAKAVRTFIRVHSLFRSERLSVNIKLTLHKALIRSVMTLAPPGNLRQTPTFWNCSEYKTRFSAPLEILQDAHWSAICTRLSTFLMNRTVQTTSRSHTLLWEYSCSRHRTRRSQAQKI
jgi:hypothetical protein